MNGSGCFSTPEDRPGRPAVYTLPLLREVEVELFEAVRGFDPFNSPHEGWAVIREELDELWECVRANAGRGADARLEAIQVAAMAVRYVMDLCEVDNA